MEKAIANTALMQVVRDEARYVGAHMIVRANRELCLIHSPHLHRVIPASSQHEILGSIRSNALDSARMNLHVEDHFVLELERPSIIR